MTIFLGCAACTLILLGLGAIAWSILAGHQARCLPRVIAYRTARAVLRTRWAWRCRWRWKGRGRPPVRDEGGEKLTVAEYQALGNLAAGRDVRART